MLLPPNKLKVGLLWNGDHLRRWQVLALEKLIGTGLADPVLTIIPVKGFQSTIRPSIAYRIFNKFTSPAALEPVELPSLWRNLPQVKVEVQSAAKGRETFPAQALEQIKSHQPDVLIRFGFNILSGDILNIAPLGIWSYHHGDPEYYRGGPPAFWEFLEGKKGVGAVLQRLNENLDQGEILHSGYFNVYSHSLKQTLQEMLEVSSAWLGQAALNTINNTFLPVSNTKRGKFTTYPESAAVLNAFLKLLAGRFSFYFQKYLTTEDWAIGRLHQPISELIHQKKLPEPFWVEASRGRQYLADPFSYQHNGKQMLVCEQFDYSTGKGSLVVNGLLNPSAGWEPGPVGSPHFSFPYIFEHLGETWMIPESRALKKIKLFKLMHNGEWTHFADLLENTDAADPALFFHDNKFWLLFSAGHAEGVNRDTHVYFADDLVGPYHPHANNPVVSDIRFGRNAGTIFHHEGKVYRPVQDSEGGYGSRLHLMEITSISSTHFRQQLVTTIHPPKGKYRQGIHTLSSAGAYTLIDGKRKVVRFSGILHQLGIHYRK